MSAFGEPPPDLDRPGFGTPPDTPAPPAPPTPPGPAPAAPPDPPVPAAPAESAPAESVPLESVPLESVPAESASAESASAESASAESAPPESAPPDAAPTPAAPSPPGPSPAAPADPVAPSSPALTPPGVVRVVVRVNGTHYSAEAEPRTLLSDFLRHELGLTGTKVGCEHGACGACTVQLDGEPVRSCLTFAVQVEGADITTIEGLPHGRLQESFHEHHALQCGFCTAGILMTLDAFLKTNPDPTEDEVKAALSGNLCRCTGYRPIVEAVINR